MEIELNPAALPSKSELDYTCFSEEAWQFFLQNWNRKLKSTLKEIHRIFLPHSKY